MIYDIRHVTRYEYASAITEARCLLRLVPVDRPGQTVLGSRLEFDPQPSRTVRRVDPFGNVLVEVTFERTLRSLVIRAFSKASVERSMFAVPEATRAWESVREQARESHDLGPTSPAPFLFESRHVRFDQAVTEFAAASFKPGLPVLAAALDLAKRVQAGFVYDPRATDVSTPLIDAFKARRGVCQDFAHVMIAGLRGLGLAAAYVSGYLRTVPPPGRPRLEGADATHAWVAVWCGPELGFIGVDPTNGIQAGDDHVTLAIGRDYADIAPVDGIILASGSHRLTVGVDVIPTTQG